MGVLRWSPVVVPALVLWLHPEQVESIHVAGVGASARPRPRGGSDGGDGPEDGAGDTAPTVWTKQPDEKHRRLTNIGTPDAACRYDDSFWASYRRLHEEGRSAIARGGHPRVLIWSTPPRGGNGDQFRSVLHALFAAMRTSRVLFIADWGRSGFDVLSLFDHGHVDWTEPRELNCTTSGPSSQAESEVECVRFPPPGVAPMPLAEGARLNITSTYRLGCGWHFLFKPSHAYRDLLDARARGLKSRGGPYAAIHLRFGDYVITNPAPGPGGHQERMPVMEDVVKEALRCGLSTPFVKAAGTVVLITDSAEVKGWVSDPRWVRSRLRAGRVQVNTTRNDSGRAFKPQHTMRKSVDAEGMANAWVDQGIVAGALGVISTSGGFAYSAAEMGLLPLGSIWAFGGHGRTCRPRTSSIEESWMFRGR